ncbi:hypothetical protein BGZ80_003625, partial [Entomortierella chlamydospora]
IHERWVAGGGGRESESSDDEVVGNQNESNEDGDWDFGTVRQPSGGPGRSNNIYSNEDKARLSDSGYDTVRSQYYRNIENIEHLSVQERQTRSERPVSTDMTRDKVYQTFVRPLHGLCLRETERNAVDDIRLAFENAEREIPGITRLFVKGLSEQLSR